MLATLAAADAVTWLSIFVKALAYAATLIAIGSVMILFSMRELSEGGRAALRQSAVISAVVAAIFSVLRLPVRASFLMGGTWDGAFDTVILGMVTESPLGTSIALRLAGLALILCVIWRSPIGQWLALLGSLLASVSFALRGHALGEPQIVLGTLITVHILGLSFWVGAFAPLARSARFDPPAQAGALAYEFGALALWVVGLLILAGGVMLMLLGAATPAVLSSDYGQLFAIKLILFAGVLALAGVNKLSLTPALLASTPGAGTRLRRTIGYEAVLVAGVLITTATLTTVSSPPSNDGTEQAAFLSLPLPHAQHIF